MDETYPKYSIEDIKDTVADEDLFDHIINNNNILVETEGEEVDVFFRKSTGIVCPAKRANEQHEDSRCVLCYGTGFLGGYDKYRNKTHLFEPTNSYTIGVSLSGITVGIGDKRNKGTISAGLTGMVTTNWMLLDDFRAVEKFDNYVENREGFHLLQYRIFGDVWKSYSSISSESLRNKKIRFRTILKRTTTSQKSPEFYKLRFRYRNATTKKAKIVIQEEGQRFKFGNTGLTVENVPPMWTGPEPFMDEGTLIEVSSSRRFKVSNNKETRTGLSSRLVLQEITPNQIASGDPLQKVFD